MSGTRCVWCTVLSAVLFAATALSESIAVWKCCFRGEQLHPNGRDCVPRAGQRVDPLLNIHNESTLVLRNTRPHDLYWLPPELQDRDLSVHYAATFSCNKFRVFSSNDTSRVSFEEDMNVTLRTLDASGQKIETVFETADYCLDASNGPIGPWVIRMCTFEVLTQVNKCCPQGQLIVHENGLPECVENRNVTLHGSAGIRRMNTASDYVLNSYSLCTTGEFQTFRHPNITEGFMLWFLEGRPSTLDGTFWRYMCLDAEQGANNSLLWTLGYCSFPILNFQALMAATYLTVPSAALLTAALVAVLLQAHTRRSTHGRALACHAASLLAAHVTHAVYTLGDDTHCQELAIVINFFLMASALWLQIICINMTRGFSQILHATKNSSRRTNNIRTIFFYSLYGWGCPTLATIVIVCTLTDYKFSAPLYHTKTCFYEQGPVSRTSKTSSFFYYYGPMCIILILNIGMFVFTALKIRMMRQDSSILNRKEDGQPSGTTKSAVLYGKLLLLMGVLEMAADVTAWVAKDSDVRAGDGARVTDKLVVYNAFLQRELTYRWVAHVVDLLRAMSVFALCCCGQRARRQLYDVIVRGLRCGTTRPTPPMPARPAANTATATQTGTPRARLPGWLVQPFRRRVRPDDIVPEPRLSLETITSRLEGDSRMASDT